MTKRVFDFSNFLTNTIRVHPSICHICLEAGNDQVRITIPAVIGNQVRFGHRHLYREGSGIRPSAKWSNRGAYGVGRRLSGGTQG